MPRMMFPPPTTIASSTPEMWTSAISSASESMRSWSMPKSCSPESASPDSLSRTRWNLAPAGAGVGLAAMSGLLCHGEALELDHVEPRLAQHVADAAARVVDPGLLLEDDLLEPLPDPALHDLLAHLLGLVLDVGLLGEDLLLRVDLRLRHVGPAHVQRPRRGDVHREPVGLIAVAAGVYEHTQLVGRRMDVGAEDVTVGRLVAHRVADDDVLPELGDEVHALFLELADGVLAVLLDGVEHALREDHELRVVGDRLGLAADGDHRADALLGQVEHDLPLGGLAAGPLGGLREALLADDLDGGVDVALGVDERALAVHHPGARALAELLDEAGRNLGHECASSVSVTGSGCSAGSGSVATVSGSAAAVSGSPAAASGSGAGLRASSSAVTFCLPASIPSAITRVISEHERIASSLPGIT